MSKLLMAIASVLIVIFLIWFVPVFIWGITSTPESLRCHKESLQMSRSLSGEIVRINPRRESLLWIKIKDVEKSVSLKVNEVEKTGGVISLGDYLYKPEGDLTVQIFTKGGDTLEVYGGFYCK